MTPTIARRSCPRAEMRESSLFFCVEFRERFSFESAERLQQHESSSFLCVGFREMFSLENLQILERLERLEIPESSLFLRVECRGRGLGVDASCSSVQGPGV